MKKYTLSTLAILVVAICMVIDYGCKKSDNTSPYSAYAVSIANDVTHGKYLVDKNGYTLYFFSNDFKGRNSCPGGCASVWPYFYAGPLTQASLGAGLNLADFDTIIVNGTNQTRYKGWPLYYYYPGGTAHESAGQITGESISNWFVAKPDYTIMLANGQMVGNDGNNYLSTYAAGLGNTIYLTDAQGLTLYTFTPDSFDINKYTNSTFSNNPYWPIYDTIVIVVPSALDKTLFSITTVYGKNQLSYKGWPLYYFASDSKIRGNTKGISIPPSLAAGSKWPVAQPGMASAPHK
jgi:predicted lipoprotein with Yx(FWY)xxD motif